MGRAIAAHVRVRDASFITPFLLGVLVWSGLYLRDDRLRQLLPLRQTQSTVRGHHPYSRSGSKP